MTIRKSLSLALIGVLAAVFMFAAPGRASADEGRYWYKGNAYQYYHGGHGYRHRHHHHRYWTGYRPHPRFYSPYYRYPHYRPYFGFGYWYR